VDQLTLDPRNARKHSEKNISAICKSLKRFGQRKAIVVQKEGMVVRAGNGTLTAAKQLGWSHIAAVVVDEDDPKAQAFAIADNRSAELGEWDVPVLFSVMDELDEDLVGDLEFDEDELNALSTELTAADVDNLVDEALSVPVDPDEDPVPIIVPSVAVTGESLDMGKHLLYCGDNLKLLQALGDDSMDACVTDPPYGTKSPGKVQTRSGKATPWGIDWDVKFPTEWLAETWRVLKPGAALLTFCDAKAVSDVWRAVAKVGFHPLQIVAWAKTNPPPQPRKNFQSGLELAVFARKPGKVLYWGGGGTTPNWFQSGTARLPSGVGSHPTPKSVKLMHWLLELLVPPGGTVLDPFCGSGTTIVAAEHHDCYVYAAELQPKYCDVAHARWKRLVEERDDNA
jgi:DNA modification methylase